MIKKTLLCGILALISVESFANLEHSSQKTAANALEDAAIINKINTLYAHSPILKGLPISVIAFEHNVVISGVVATDTQYERAISLADSVAGVGEIGVDKLTVKESKAPLTDTFLTAKVKGMLLKEKLFGRKSIDYWPITIETKNSVVYLSGKLTSVKQRTNLVNLVQTVSGIKFVNSSITIEPISKSL